MKRGSTQCSSFLLPEKLIDSLHLNRVEWVSGHPVKACTPQWPLSQRLLKPTHAVDGLTARVRPRDLEVEGVTAKQKG